MNGVPALEVLRLEGRHRQNVCLEGGQRGLEALQILRLGEDRDVGIAAKLRGAVEDSCLAAHEQVADAVLAHRRKDYASRARDRDGLPGR